MILEYLYLNEETGSTGYPFASVAIVNQITDSNHTIWCATSAGTALIHLYTDSNRKLIFQIGDSPDYLKFESTHSMPLNEFYSVYIDYNAGPLNGGFTSYNHIRIKTINLINGSVSNIQGTWSNVSNGPATITTDSLFIGSVDTNGTDNWSGYIASCVFTTLRNNSKLPDETQISLMTLDPIKWMNIYKINSTFRKVSGGTENFELNDLESSYYTNIFNG